MSSAPVLDTLPDPNAIRQRLQQLEEESTFLRRLLRLVLRKPSQKSTTPRSLSPTCGSLGGSNRAS